jgi:hypothetical protein
MGTKESGWLSSLVFRARFLALALSVSSVAVLASAGTAYAVDQKKSRDKIVDLNKQALLSYEAKDFDAAKDLLNKALKEAKQAGLDDDKMTARTYLHLGAVYFAGYQDQAAAIQNFTLAKKIRPDIQLTPSIETPEMKGAFDQATVEAEPAPAPVEPEPRPAKSQPAARMASTPDLAGGSEPDLPSSMSAPLMCSTPDEAPPSKELSIRCAVKPGVNAKSVQLHYRAPGAEAFQVLAMRRTAKGWYLATIPSHVMKGQSLQVYYDARDARDNEVASNGQIDSPTVIEIRKKGAGGGSAGQDEGDPLEAIKRQQKLERYETGLHRRREGAVWFGLGGGAGWGFAPAGHLEWEKDIQVSAITTVAGAFQAVIDGGYMVSDNFSAGLQFRLEWIQQQQAADTSRSGAPTVWAPAFLFRPTYFVDLSSDGNFQASLSAYAGYGYVRLPVKPVKKETTNSNGDIVPDDRNTIAKTDTRPIGPVLFGAGLGLTYHLSRHFSLALDAQLLTGLADFGVAAQAAGQLQIAFGGKAGPVPDGEEEEGEGNEGGAAPGNDAPSSDSPGSNESEEQ